MTVRAHRPPVRQPGLVVHRRNAVDVERDAVRRGGLAVVRIEQAIVESWPLLPLVDRRAPALVGLRDGRTTADALLACLSRQPTAAGANEMRRLFRLVEDGCHSELELWGHDKVFSDPSVPRSERQHPVSLGVRTIYLDRYFEQEMVAVELDGAAYHGLPGQRERDLQRDASLARRGILVVRYSHRRLHAGPHEVIDELLAILAMRRAQLRVA